VSRILDGMTESGSR